MASGDCYKNKPSDSRFLSEMADSKRHANVFGAGCSNGGRIAPSCSPFGFATEPVPNSVLREISPRTAWDDNQPCSSAQLYSAQYLQNGDSSDSDDSSNTIVAGHNGNVEHLTHYTESVSSFESVFSKNDKQKAWTISNIARRAIVPFKKSKGEKGKSKNRKIEAFLAAHRGGGIDASDGLVAVGTNALYSSNESLDRIEQVLDCYEYIKPGEAFDNHRQDDEDPNRYYYEERPKYYSLKERMAATIERINSWFAKPLNQGEPATAEEIAAMQVRMDAFLAKKAAEKEEKARIARKAAEDEELARKKAAEVSPAKPSEIAMMEARMKMFYSNKGMTMPTSSMITPANKLTDATSAKPDDVRCSVKSNKSPGSDRCKSPASLHCDDSDGEQATVQYFDVAKMKESVEELKTSGMLSTSTTKL